MIDNEKVMELFYEYGYDEELNKHARFIFKAGYAAGYAARDKEAEEEKRELIEALILGYSNNNWWGEGDYHRWSKKEESQIKELIEKHTGKPIDEVI